ncbi:MAG: glycosyltransferase [Thaumarchaeota archaeon]|nr:glycosyltransferase [Nitrososphaerota archaeon]
MSSKMLLLISNDFSHPAFSKQQIEFSYRINRLRPLAKAGYNIVVVSAGGKVGTNGRVSFSSLIPRITKDGDLTIISPPILRIPMLWLFQSLLMTPLVALLYCFSTKTKPEAILAGTVVYGAVARVLNRFLRVPLIVDYGDPDYVRERSLSLSILRLLERLVFQRPGVSAVTYIDPNISDYLRRYRIARKTFLPPGGYWKDQPLVASDAYRMADESATIVYAGHVAPPPVYRLDLLVEAARLLLQKSPKTRFLIVGTGEYLPTMVDTARRFGILQSFVFTGAVPYSHAKKLITESDVAVQLLADMCMGTKVMDYFALGKPALCTGSFYNSYHDFLKPMENCVLVPPDAKQISDALQLLISNPGLRQRLGESALKSVEDFDWESQSVEILKLIDDCKTRST